MLSFIFGETDISLWQSYLDVRSTKVKPILTFDLMIEACLLEYEANREGAKIQKCDEFIFNKGKGKKVE